MTRPKTTGLKASIGLTASDYEDYLVIKDYLKKYGFKAGPSSILRYALQRASRELRWTDYWQNFDGTPLLDELNENPPT